MKIAYIFPTLAKTGGTERMITEKANYFAEQFGYDVTIINCFEKDGDINHFNLSKKVKQKPTPSLNKHQGVVTVPFFHFL